MPSKSRNPQLGLAHAIEEDFHLARVEGRIQQRLKTAYIPAHPGRRSLPVQTPFASLACAAGPFPILERETGFEPATNSLEGCDSTTELLPQKQWTVDCDQ